jgi:hypothetical protein
VQSGGEADEKGRQENSRGGCVSGTIFMSTFICLNIPVKSLSFIVKRKNLNKYESLGQKNISKQRAFPWPP